MLYIICGLPRNGKSVYLTREIVKDLDRDPNLHVPIYVNWDIEYITRQTFIRHPYSYILRRNDLFFRIPNFCRRLPLIKKFVIQEDILHSTKHSSGRLKKYQNFEDLLKLKEADIYIDEMGGLLFNRDWKTIPSTFIKYLQQHGKKGIDIIGATQSVDSIEVNFRRLCAGIAIVSKVFQPNIFKRSRSSQHRGFPLFKVEVVHRHPYLGDKDEKILYDHFFYARKKYLQAFDTKQDIVTKEYGV